MKVAMIGLRGIPAKSGGVEMTVDHLAPRLQKLGADITVFCRTSYCDGKPKSYKGVKLKYLPSLNTKFTESISHTTLASLRTLLSKFDIIHYHAMGNGIFSIMQKKKTVVTLHGLDYEREKWNIFAKTYLKISQKSISKFPNAVISVSKKIQTLYKKQYNKKIDYIPNGVEIPKTVPLNKLKRFGIQKNKYILFLSRIVPEKGLHYLIRAMPKDYKLLIVGGATHTDAYRKTQLKSKSENIIFTGPLYGKEKDEAFSNAKLFVLPSTIEGMPVVMLEAMSYGTPVLSSDIEENTAINHGYTFKNKDVKDLNKQLTKLIKTPKLKNYKQYVKKEFNWDAIAKQTFEVYKRLL